VLIRLRGKRGVHDAARVQVTRDADGHTWLYFVYEDCDLGT
jgi:hypothetical protein